MPHPTSITDSLGHKVEPTLRYANAILTRTLVSGTRWAPPLESGTTLACHDPERADDAINSCTPSQRAD
eukprot:10870245-Alexandrium_andersonii.AAC.1